MLKKQQYNFKHKIINYKTKFNNYIMILKIKFNKIKK